MPCVPRIAKLLENDLFIYSILLTPSVPTDQMAINNELDRGLTNAVIAQFEVEYQHSCEGAEENHKSISQNCHDLVWDSNWIPPK